MFARKKALLIGVDEYEHVQPLKYCSNDVRELSQALTSKLGFDSGDVCALATASHQKPTRGRVFHELGRICASASRDDLLLFYFSGHGMVDHGSAKDYLLPCDTTTYSLRNTGICVDDIATMIQEAPCRRTVLFLDACREVYQGAKGIKSVGEEAKEAFDREGLATYFSCDPKDRSYEIDELHHGSFTYCLLEAIKEGIHRDVNALNDFLRKRVPQINQEHEKPPQQPFLILNPKEMGTLPLIVTEGGESEIDERLQQWDERMDNLEVKLYAKGLEVLLRTKRQKNKPGDERKLHLISALLSGDIRDIETFEHAWERIERSPKQAPTVRARERVLPP